VGEDFRAAMAGAINNQNSRLLGGIDTVISAALHGYRNALD
jgi:hypothetical protein